MTWELFILWIAKSWTALKVFLAVVTSLVASITIYEKAVKPYQMRRKESKQVQEKFFSDLRTMLVDISAIKGQVLPNGGTSLNDKVTVMASNVKVIGDRMKSLMAFNDKAMYWADEKLNIVSVNKKFLELFGADSEAKVLGSGTMAYIDYSEHERLWALWREALKTADELDMTYTVINGLTGERYPVRSHSIFERENGQVISICGMVERVFV